MLQKKLNTKSRVFKPDKNICDAMYRIFTILLILLQTSIAYADPLSMIFLYPGGEGSAQEAQPFLDAFTKKISDKGGPEIQAVYVNDLDDGLQQITQNKHTLGILSLEAYLKASSQRPFSPWLTTYPLASDGPYERYFLLGKNTEGEAEQGLLKGGTWTIYNAKPVNNHFLSLLFTDIPAEKPVSLEAMQTENILGILRKIASGELTNTCVLMDTYEYQSFKKISLDWTRDLRLISASKTIPASPLVLFGNLPQDQKDKLEEVFLGMNKDSKEILRGLRLKGFSPAQNTLYQEMSAAFSQAK